MKLNRSMFSLWGNLGKNGVLASIRMAFSNANTVCAVEDLYSNMGCTEKLQIRYANLRV